MGPYVRILVAGSFASPPGQGGATWAVLQYALGFRELGHDVVLVDPCARHGTVADYFDVVAREMRLDGRALLVHPDRTATGGDYGRLARWSAHADVLVNLAGVLRDEELTGSIPYRVYVDLDPGFTQLWQNSGIDMGLAGHHRFATVGQLIGTADCEIPTCGLPWHPTLPPVVLSEWSVGGRSPTLGVTTVANWRSYGPVSFGGVHYGQKAHSLREIADLPNRIRAARFEPALAIHEAESADLRLLAATGWRRIDPRLAAGTPWRYRRFVAASTAEIGVAKSGYVVSRSGWFSDRSACYLACGRPVVAQDTGWARSVPAGAGLLAFSDSDDAASAIEQILSDYPHHAGAARALARECFDSRTVLPRLLDLPAGPRLPSVRVDGEHSRRVST
jgi:hypothetical protein